MNESHQLSPYQEFIVAFMKAASAHLARLESEVPPEERAQAFHNFLWDKDGPRKVNRILTPEDEFIFTINSALVEINTSYTVLRDIEIYIRRFPYGDTEISRVRHLKYHINGYFNEVYVLQNRLKAFIPRIARIQIDPRKRYAVEQAGELLDEYVSKTLEDIREARDRHVHKARFLSDDLDRVETWEILGSPLADQDPKTNFMFREWARIKYREERKSWTKLVKTKNQTILKMMDDYFKLLHPVILDERGNLLIPKMTRSL